MKTQILASFILIILQHTAALRILGLFPYQGKSHFYVFKPYLEELSRRGHDVTVVSHFPDPTTAYRDVSLAGTVQVLEEAMPLEERSYRYLIEIGILLVSISVDNCEKMLGLKEFQQLMNQKFDLVVTEQFNSDCSLGVAYKLQVPVVSVTSHILFPYHYDRIAAPDNLAFVPFHFIESGSKPSLWQRAEIAVFRAYFKLMFRYVSQRSNQQTLERYFGPIPDLEELAEDVKVLLLYTYFPLTGMRLFPPKVVEVGGYHVAPVKALSQDIQKFIDDSEHGVLYVSFGSLVRTSSITEDKLEAMVTAFSRLKQRVIWKWENDTLPGAPDNIMTKNWLPQNDILGHKKVLAFYSHGGMLSTTEALHHAVPVLVTPVLGDQPANAASVVEAGLGLQINIADITADSLYDKLQRILQPEFRSRAQLLSGVWHDRPQSPLDTAVFWTEWAARHPGFQPDLHASGVGFLAYYSLDLIAICALAVFVPLAVLCKCCRGSKSRAVGKKRTKRD